MHISTSILITRTDQLTTNDDYLWTFATFIISRVASTTEFSSLYDVFYTYVVLVHKTNNESKSPPANLIYYVKSLRKVGLLGGSG